jgi:hypothetical protein
MDVINAPVGETSIASLKSEAPTSISLVYARSCLPDQPNRLGTRSVCRVVWEGRSAMAVPIPIAPFGSWNYRYKAMIIVSAIGSSSGLEQVFLLFWLRPFLGWSRWHV